jgi:2-keto-4-pentenoate hydratase/2-oxohepta-3-ene-1,7-dioic acid hydratase in catechol pathway
MNFVTFINEGRQQVGILHGGQIMPLDQLLKHPFNNMLDLIVSFQTEWLAQIEQQIQVGSIAGIPLANVKLLAPIPFPRRNVICLGKNYADHAREIKITKISDTFLPDRPIYFTKMASPAAGHGDVISISRRVTVQVDYEVELAVVIGKDGINIAPEQAEDHIFGYTIANDLSARDLQAGHKQWFKGKSLDGFCPLGPVLVHKNAIPWPVHLDIQCCINGELRQNSNTKNMIFDIPYIISDLSRGLTLKAGDIICTGTPSGVGMGFEPPVFLHNDDIVECSIEKIGKLTNRIVFTE